MISEGKGEIIPAPVDVKLSAADLRTCEIESLRRKGYRTDYQGTAWKAGLVGNGIFAGMLGETAVGLWLSLKLGYAVHVDFELRQWGDGGKDHEINGWRLQVKTRTKPYGSTLIRRISDNGRIMPLDWEFLVACEWTGGNVVHLLGWFTRDTSLSSTFGKSNAAGHFNIIVPDTKLEPMNRLPQMLKMRRAV